MKKQNNEKHFIGCYAHCLKDGIYAATNIGLEILNYTQVFILVKGTNKDRYFDAPVSIKK